MAIILYYTNVLAIFISSHFYSVQLYINNVDCLWLFMFCLSYSYTASYIWQCVVLQRYENDANFNKYCVHYYYFYTVIRWDHLTYMILYVYVHSYILSLPINQRIRNYASSYVAIAILAKQYFCHTRCTIAVISILIYRLNQL